MKTHRPTIQQAWADYKKLAEEEENAFGFNNRMWKAMDILMFVVPYLIANFQLAVLNPRSFRKPYARNSRKNRNI